jgi:predicted pyridoxine 5'-phosphate oxidase superfamily flavin-nucleotide-binding protein
MSDLYGETHRDFQDRQGTRALADRLESLAHRELDANDRSFIEAASLFFLATVDEKGRPTVSYKGGAPGFVRIVGPSQLMFPAYDGNGMFLSLGNISSTTHVGMLFIDFESPRRLRVQGTATVSSDFPREMYPGARHVVRVDIEQAFVNCGRYIHRMQSNGLSPHLPDAAGRQPFPQWKRLDFIADALPESDQRKVEAAGGAVSVDAYRGETDPDPRSPPA